MCSAVWVIFQTLNLCWNTVFVATEIYKAIVLLMTTTTVADCDVAVVITARTTDFLFELRGNGRAFMQGGCHHLKHAATTGRGWLNF